MKPKLVFGVDWCKLMASPTQGTWVWANTRRQWRAEELGAAVCSCWGKVDFCFPLGSSALSTWAHGSPRPSRPHGTQPSVLVNTLLVSFWGRQVFSAVLSFGLVFPSIYFFHPLISDLMSFVSDASHISSVLLDITGFSKKYNVNLLE